MNRKLHFSLLMVLALTLMAAGSAAATDTPRPEPSVAAEGPSDPDDDDLFGHCRHLSDAQIQGLKQLQRQFREETRDLHREIRQRHLALAAELAKKTPDPDAARKILGELSALKTEMARKRLENRLLAKKIDPDSDFGPWHHHPADGPGFSRDF